MSMNQKRQGSLNLIASNCVLSQARAHVCTGRVLGTLWRKLTSQVSQSRTMVPQPNSRNTLEQNVTPKIGRLSHLRRPSQKWPRRKCCTGKAGERSSRIHTHGNLERCGHYQVLLQGLCMAYVFKRHEGFGRNGILRSKFWQDPSRPAIYSQRMPFR